VDVLVANIPWCPSDSSQDFRMNALYNVYVAAAGVPHSWEPYVQMGLRVEL